MWGDNQLNFELLWGVYGGEREEEEGEQMRERDVGVLGECRDREEKGKEKRGLRAMTKMPIPLFFFVPNCFIFDTASLIRNPNSKFNNRQLDHSSIIHSQACLGSI